jgi:hypothetical protein
MDRPRGKARPLGDSQTLEDGQTSQKAGPKNSGETLKNRRDREIGGSAKNRSGVAGAVEDHRRPRNLDDEEP